MGIARQCFAHGCDDTVVCQVTVVCRATIDIPDKHMGSLTRSFCEEHGEQMFHVLQVLLVEGVPDETKSEAIQVLDRVVCHEGSWAGRRGVVVAVGPFSALPEGSVKVRFDDDGKTETVVACTLAREIDEHA